MEVPPLDQSLADRFRKSLICNLSLSSKELFHSNFLGWLLENSPDFAKRFLGDGSPVKDVKREKHNFDLLVITGNGIHVIENKVKSTPNLDQLRAYEAKIKKAYGKATLTLLSLMEPPEDFRKKMKNLTVVRYDEISDWISEVEFPAEHRQVIREYRFLISVLLSIQQVATDMSPGELFHFRKEQERLLGEMRLFDVAQKIRYGCFVKSVIRRFLSENRAMDFPFEQEVGLTRSRGLASFKLRLPGRKDLLMGIQIQGSSFRRFIESGSGKCMQKNAQTLQGITDPWLDGKLLKFGPPFKYTNRKLPDDITLHLLQEQTLESLDLLLRRSGEFAGKLG